MPDTPPTARPVVEPEIDREYLDRHFQEELARFKKMCPVEQDPVLTILRAHLLTEYYIERLLGLLLPRGDRFADGLHLSYTNKLAFVDSLDVLSDKTIGCLRALNRVRNSCAHEMDREITLADIERIGKPLGGPFVVLRRNYVGDLPQLLSHTMNEICLDLTYNIWKAEKSIALTHDQSPNHGTHEAAGPESPAQL